MRGWVAACCGWIGLSACQDWRDQVRPELVASDPEQVLVEGLEPTTWTEDGNVITLSPRAQYRVSGYVVEISRQLLDEWDFVVPMDVALVWGPAADPEVLKAIQFHLTNRYLSYRTKRGELLGRLRGHVSNNHLLPKSPEIADAIDQLEIGDLVTLEGQLVDLEIKSPKGHLRHRNKSSLSRTDDGSGACEQLWVERVSLGPGG